MLFSTVYARSLVFVLCSGSVVLATPVPDDQLMEARADDIPSDVLVITGVPELLDLPEKRSFIEDEDELTRRQSATPPTADHVAALRLHNAARAKKKLTALKWDKKLEADAKAWAKKLAAKDKMTHSTSAQRPGQGENLAYTWSTARISDPVTKGTKLWLAEEKNYKGQKIPEGNFASYGHWTQCMWKTTTKIGIAAVGNGKGAYYIVARYSPPGNYVGQRPY